MSSRSKSDGKGAAEEPQPELEGSLSSSSTASYDPTVFQRPHPDDRGGASSKPRKVKSKDKAQGKSEGGKGVLAVRHRGVLRQKLPAGEW